MDVLTLGKVLILLHGCPNSREGFDSPYMDVLTLGKVLISLQGCPNFRLGLDSPTWILTLGNVLILTTWMSLL